MTFTENNYLVKFYIRKINEGSATREEVPALFNLREVVSELLDA